MVREDIEKYVHDGYLHIIAKPNSRKTEVTGYDEERNALLVNVAARPEDNRANIEIIKFFTRELKRKVSMKSGLTSKTKTLKIE